MNFAQQFETIFVLKAFNRPFPSLNQFLFQESAKKFDMKKIKNMRESINKLDIFILVFI